MKYIDTIQNLITDIHAKPVYHNATGKNKLSFKFKTINLEKSEQGYAVYILRNTDGQYLIGYKNMKNPKVIMNVDKLDGDVEAYQNWSVSYLYQSDSESDAFTVKWLIQEISFLLGCPKRTINFKTIKNSLITQKRYMNPFNTNEHKKLYTMMVSALSVYLNYKNNMESNILFDNKTSWSQINKIANIKFKKFKYGEY